MRCSLHSPNGQFGCLSLYAGSVMLTIGFVPALFGVDLVIGSRMWTLGGRAL